VDVVVAFVLLVFLLPLIGIVAMIVRITLGSPVLFRQERPGRYGVPFVMLKFRTMTEAPETGGALRPDAERLTKVGKILRRTSLDELPEFLNVLTGDMSLVGPRPLLMRYYENFREDERLRFSVRPGITGLAQVRGRNDLRWDTRIELDLLYVRQCSLTIDVKLLLLTVWRVLRSEGVQSDPGAVMLDFDEERKRKDDVRATT
jgi:lipopolysaccharide/colanic/teichoic acid biosynthesis glycosyltransferase